jgi:hypothetical protein
VGKDGQPVPYYLPGLIDTPDILRMQVFGANCTAVKWLLWQFKELAGKRNSQGQQQYPFIRVEPTEKPDVQQLVVNIPALKAQVLGMAHAALLREQARLCKPAAGAVAGEAATSRAAATATAAVADVAAAPGGGTAVTGVETAVPASEAGPTGATAVAVPVRTFGSCPREGDASPPVSAAQDVAPPAAAQLLPLQVRQALSSPSGPAATTAVASPAAVGVDAVAASPVSPAAAKPIAAAAAAAAASPSAGSSAGKDSSRKFRSASRLLRAFLDSTQDPQAVLDAGPVFAALASSVAATVDSCAAACGGSPPGEYLAAAVGSCPVPGVTTPLEVVDFCLRYVALLVSPVSLAMGALVPIGTTSTSFVECVLLLESSPPSVCLTVLAII